ncbi:MAG: ATP-binding protein [Bacteroidota bacterium]
MNDWPIKQLLVFHNRVEKIYPFLQDVVAFIERHLPQKADQISFSARVIVTELLTNSIKHAGKGETGIELSISPDVFIIKKIDQGEPFDLKQEGATWPLDNDIKTPVKIYSDALNGLYANIISPYSLSFYAESYPNNNDTFEDISEHYGLVIICRASSSFVYLYNPRSRQNIFTVTINLV